MQDEIHVGRIMELWIPEGSRSGCGLVTVEAFELTDTVHVAFDMPVLRKCYNVPEFVTVQSEVILVVKFPIPYLQPGIAENLIQFQCPA
jgi:hypothetical protein